MIIPNWNFTNKTSRCKVSHIAYKPGLKSRTNFMAKSKFINIILCPCCFLFLFLFLVFFVFFLLSGDDLLIVFYWGARMFCGWYYSLCNLDWTSAQSLKDKLRKHLSQVGIPKKEICQSCLAKSHVCTGTGEGGKEPKSS